MRPETATGTRLFVVELVAELAVSVVSPALGATVDQGAAVIAARGDRLHATREAGNGNWHEAVRRRVVPELAVDVVSPALDAAVDHGAAVIAARGDRLHAAREAENGNWHEAVRRRAVAELAI